jgi:hypothetical protein
MKPLPRKFIALGAGLFIVTGTTAAVEGWELDHTESRQYEEPTRMTYENANSTATVAAALPLLDLNLLSAMRMVGTKKISDD